MTFGHDPFIWTPVQVIKNAETASGNLVFNLSWNDVTDWVDDTVGDFIPDEWKDDISDKLKEIKGKVKKVGTFVKDKWEYLTGEDEIIDIWTVEWCCPDGSRQRVIYGKYRVSEKESMMGGPKTVNGVSYVAGDEYIAAFTEQTTGDFYTERGGGYYNDIDWNTTSNTLGRKYSSVTTDGKKKADFGSAPFGAPPRTVEEKVDGVPTGNTQQVPALTIQQLVDNLLEEADMWKPGCSTEGVVEGCMNSVASNYNKNATCPDGSCRCGDDEAGRSKTFNRTGTECVVTPCEDTNREVNSDSSCGDGCKEGFSFKKGVYPKQCVPTPVDCVVSGWSAWSACDKGQQTRTRTITTEPAYGGKTCEWVVNTSFLKNSMEREPVEFSETRICAMPSTNGTTGRGTDPNNCAQANRVKKDDDTCGDCKTDYEEDDDSKCVEIAEPETETQEGLPIGLIIGGVAIGGLALVMAMR